MLLRVLVCALSFAFAGGVAAQTYRWVDKDGKVRYGDTPPPGVSARQLSGPPAPPAPAAAPEAATKGAKKGPSTPADLDRDFRRRQAEAQKASDKAAREARDAETKRDNCARARETLAGLESGQRIVRTGADGERYYLDDAQREAEIRQARESVNSWCN